MPKSRVNATSSEMSQMIMLIPNQEEVLLVYLQKLFRLRLAYDNARPISCVSGKNDLKSRLSPELKAA